MKDYYQILRVRRGASTAEIKRAYRVLVQQLHPDVNPNPAAHELIKEVNEAYDVLGDSAKKQAYDYSLDNPYTTINVPQEPVHRDPRYRRSQAHRPATPRGSTQRDLMQKFMPSVAWIAWIGCGICFIMIIDFGIPHRVIRDTAVDYESRGSRRSQANYIITASGRELKISAEDTQFFQEGQPVEIIESTLLSILIEIRLPEDEHLITNLSTPYQNFKFVPFLLFVFSAMGAFRKGSVEFRFNLGIMNFFVLIFTLILLLK